jgi:hypothetical protein
MMPAMATTFRSIALVAAAALFAACPSTDNPRVDLRPDGPPPAGIHEVRPGGSIQAAIDKAKPGEDVHIYPGTYKPAQIGEAFVVLGAAKNGIAIRGKGKDPSEVVLDGASQVLHVLYAEEGIGRQTLIENLTITGGNADPGKLFPGGVTSKFHPEYSSDNDFYYDGAGLMLFRAAPTLRRLRVVDNRAVRCGAGISTFCPDRQNCPSPGPLIEGCEILRNLVNEGTGGGIDGYFGSRLEIVNTLIVGNSGWGSGVAVLEETQATIDGCTIVGSARHGIGIHTNASATVTNTIVADSQDEGIQTEGTGKATVSHSLFWNNVSVWTPPAGNGNKSVDPLFVKGPRGDHYLSQVAAGQPADSQAVNGGSATAAAKKLDALTTRSDGKPDTGQADIGYHYRP